MHTTSLTLIERVRQADDREAWHRLVQLYAPLLMTWAGKAGLQPTDAADLVQDIFVTLLKELPAFRYDANRSFRGWLKTLTMNRLTDLRRRAAVRSAVPLGSVPELSVDDPAELFWDREYQEVLLRNALDLMECEFDPGVWRAGTAFMFSGRPARDIARETGQTENAVYIAKCRVQRRLRETIAGLME
ncbi:MAG: sigma-70 family RNA polymerase sigma factor [Gemmataceae bacterium]|nr:sigma-70 family RNA polymerase sigma factor [Gemmataceae bacterium]